MVKGATKNPTQRQDYSEKIYFDKQGSDVFFKMFNIPLSSVEK